MAEKILVVDDDPQFQRLVKRYLEQHSYSVLTAEDGANALTMAKEDRPDLILSDCEMPVLDGHSLCRRLRQESSALSIPLILVSGTRIDESNILAGFEGGADDYVLKPFSMPVLLARIEAVLRRYRNASTAGPRLRKSGLELDPAGRTVKVAGKKISLTRKEFDLLTQLIGNAGRVLSVAHLLEMVWGYDPADYNDPGTVETHVSHLRKKLGPEFASHLVTVTGHGYKFEE